MNKYDVLANLDIDSIGNNSVKSWIDALNDGEYLSFKGIDDYDLCILIEIFTAIKM